MVDIVSIHSPLNESAKHIISAEILHSQVQPVIIVNTSRALLIDQVTLIKGLANGKIKAYLTDVMDEEPKPANHPLTKLDNVIITPHIGSRTRESVERKGCASVKNLQSVFNKTITFTK